MECVLRNSVTVPRTQKDPATPWARQDYKERTVQLFPEKKDA